MPPKIGPIRGPPKVAQTAMPVTQLNGINPEAYLREVLSRIADHPINRMIPELLPWNIGLQQAAKAEAE
jgi:hypothetical protein